jgi:hypothetical protein
MKKFITIIICLAILGIAFYYAYDYWQMRKGELDNFATWKEFIPRSGLFKVLLPHAPQYAKDYISIPNSDQKRRYDMYVSEKIDGTVFLISVITYPPEADTSAPKEILRQNLDELMHQKPDNQLTKLLNTMFQQHQTLEFSFENRDLHVEGKAIQHDHIVYMLTYITNKQNFDPEEYHHFVHSFQILDQRKKINQ